MTDFAALRFIGDENICDNVYWYRGDFPVKEGDYVLAPVGVHNRLQRARVERTLRASDENAPYDVRLIKSVAAKCGARKLVCGDTPVYELGGARYDEKHFTRFGVMLVSERLPDEREPLSAYGVTRYYDADGDFLSALAGGTGCALVYGVRAQAFAIALLSLVRGEAGAEEYFLARGLSRAEITNLQEKLR